MEKSDNYKNNNLRVDSVLVHTLRKVIVLSFDCHMKENINNNDVLDKLYILNIRNQLTQVVKKNKSIKPIISKL